MPRPRKHKPSDPADITARRAADRDRAREIARDPARWGLSGQALDLPVNATVSARRDAAGRIVRARRQDMFDVLLQRGALAPEAHAAVRRLQDDVTVLHRAVSGTMDYSPRIDRSRSGDTFTEARHRAASRVKSVLDQTGPEHARLLDALCQPPVGLSAEWRSVVARLTGVTRADRQVDCVRSACEALAEAYRSLGRRRPAV